MEISQTYISAVVIILSAILQLLKVQIAPADLNTFVLVGSQIILGVYIIIRKMQKGEINAFGQIKK